MKVFTNKTCRIRRCRMVLQTATRCKNAGQGFRGRGCDRHGVFTIRLSAITCKHVMLMLERNYHADNLSRL